MNFSALDRYLHSIPETFGTPGLSCRVFYKGKEVYRTDVGVRDLFSGEKMQGDEQFFVFSATKPITAAASMQLFERGILSPNDYLSYYFPEFDKMSCMGVNGWPYQAKEKITLRHLLSMTAGLTYDFNTPAIRKVVEESQGKAGTVDIVRAMSKSMLQFEPGTHWRYCEGHDIMAAVIEVATGMPYEEYVKQNIFDPLGMTSSCFHKSQADPARMTFCYDTAPDGSLIRRERFGFDITPAYVSGGASLITTADDYIRFVDALSCGGLGSTGKRILLSATVELMHQNLLTPEMRRDIPWRPWIGYGYGYGVRTLVDKGEAGSLGPVGEFGWDGLKGAYLIADTTNEISLFYVEQTGLHKDEIFPRVRNLLYTGLFSD